MLNTFESVPEDSSQFDVLYSQAQKDGLVGALQLVLPQWEVVSYVIDGLGLLVSTNGSGVRCDGKMLPAGCTDGHTNGRTNQKASRDEHTRAIEHHSRTTRSEQSDSKIFRFYCTVSRLVAACSISIEERFL